MKVSLKIPERIVFPDFYIHFTALLTENDFLSKNSIDIMKTLAYIIVVNVNGNVTGNVSGTVIGNVHRLGW